MSCPIDTMQALRVLTDVIFDDSPDAIAAAFTSYVEDLRAVEVLIAVQVWIDAIPAAHNIPPDRTDTTVFGFAVADKDTGQPVDVDNEQVSPALRTAARLVTARLNGDRATFEALAKAVPDEDQFRQVCASILQMCASTIRPAAIADLKQAGYLSPGSQN